MPEHLVGYHQRLVERFGVTGARRHYRAHAGDAAAWERAKRPKVCKLGDNRGLARIVANKLQLEWAPGQIAGRLRRRYPDKEAYQVSHQTIYKSLHIQTHGAPKKELLKYLRRTRDVANRAVPGHWEDDQLCGTKESQIITPVERYTRCVMLVRAPRKDTETELKALTRHAQKLPRELQKSLTWDRGSELSDHKTFSLATDINVCFCDPQHPWQRGSNENTNALLRQYFPKGMDLSNVHQNRLSAVARRLNERPRKTPGYYSPAEKFAGCVAATD